MKLTIATGDYDRVAPLREGRIRPEGLELNWLTLRVEEIFWRMIRHREFDAAELSLSGYILQRSQGIDDFVAIPVFPSRTFRHSCIYVNADSGINRPEDLRGRRIGVPEYQMTAAVWARGLLADDYAVQAKELEWVQGGLENPGRTPFVPVEPEGVRLQFAPADATLSKMVASGELDALISPRVPSTFHENEGPVRQLFPKPWIVERDYFERTRIFPIMHTFVIRREILETDPWIAQTMFMALLEAKRLAQAALFDTTALRVTLPFLIEHASTTVELMGEDFWPYGIEANRPTISTLMRYLVEQGMMPELLDIDTLFAESTRAMRVGI
jgi:4,5-dihydroxyphthalate decarboxylase